MTGIIWQPDTCVCVIDIDEGEFFNRCALHKESSIDDVKAHNRSFNIKEISREQRTANKAAEKERSKNYDGL